MLMVCHISPLFGLKPLSVYTSEEISHTSANGGGEFVYFVYLFV